MIDIIQFNITSSIPFNEVFNVVFTVFLYVIPVKLVAFILHKASKWF